MTKYRVLIIYRNFLAKSGPASHIGLGINALHTARVLRKHGVLTDIAPAWQPEDVYEPLRKGVYTHCVIEAPWIPTARLNEIISTFPDVQFAVRCHSQIGFLQVEAGAIGLLIEQASLQDASLNFHLAGNAARFCEFFRKAYHHKIDYLPNLYDIGGIERFHHHAPGSTLRIGSFGATRLMKNHTTAAAAALLIGRRRRANIEFHISVNREESGKGVLAALRKMFEGLNWAKLVEVPWMPWPKFRVFVGSMDLCLQLSWSETFNIVTADAAAEQVPSVISDAIDWAPKSWVAATDDPDEAARVGDALLSDPHAGREGHQALHRFIETASADWKRWLTRTARHAAMDLADIRQEEQ